jgi:hypothetical protein
MQWSQNNAGCWLGMSATYMETSVLILQNVLYFILIS